MRKPQEFVIYPARPEDPTRTIQSDKSIGEFDRTGKGRLCTNGKYFIHLSLATEYQFPMDVVNQAFENAPVADADGGIDIMKLL